MKPFYLLTSCVLLFFSMAGCSQLAIEDNNLISQTVSEYSCKVDNDCLLVLRQNIPSSEMECLCDYSCEGEVTNVEEAQIREDAYEVFCDGKFKSDGTVDSYNNDGTVCPVASCAKECFEIICEDQLCIKNVISCEEAG